MSNIKSKHTKLELSMEKILRKNNIPYYSQPNLFGSPDFLVNDKIVLFCDSSFWHGRNWKILKKKLEQGNNPNYWVEHIRRNRIRDKLVTKKLVSYGYDVIRLWDNEISKQPDLCVKKIKNYFG